MTDARRWTDADGTTWTIERTTVTGEPNQGEPPGGSERDRMGALRFRSGQRTLTVRTQRTGDLAELQDGQLRELLERAREDRDADPDRVRDAARRRTHDSPDAVGRESAPHVDPAEHGPGAET